jgi:hypothetical protein
LPLAVFLDRAIAKLIKYEDTEMWLTRMSLPPVEDKSDQSVFRTLVDESEYSPPTLFRSKGRDSPSRANAPRLAGQTPPIVRVPARRKPASVERRGPHGSQRGCQAPRGEREKNELSPCVNGQKTNSAHGSRRWTRAIPISRHGFRGAHRYYKQVYGTEGKPTVKEQPAQAEGKRPSNRRRPPKKGPQDGQKQANLPREPKSAASVTPPVAKEPASKAKEVVSSNQTPPKKQGLLARLFKRKKGDA